MHNAIFCAGCVTGMVLTLVILNPSRIIQKSAPPQGTPPISRVNRVAREMRLPPMPGPCLASTGRCMDIDAPPPQICLVSSQRCAAIGRVELVTTLRLPEESSEH